MQRDTFDAAADKERRAVADGAAFAASIRNGGECRCDEYGVFKLTLKDGRVFRKIGMHGWGGIFRGRQRTLASARSRVQQACDDGRALIFYLAIFYCGSEIITVMPDEIADLDLEPECTCSENGLTWNWPEHQPGCPVVSR